MSERRLRLVHVPPEEGRDGTSACGSHNDHLIVVHGVARRHGGATGGWKLVAAGSME